jgi:hypothetical protein
MTTRVETVSALESSSVPRSFVSILAGLLTTALLALVVDAILHAVAVFPPWGQPYFGTGPYLLAVTYRSIFNVVGFLVTARLAPRHPLGHITILAAIGLALSLLSIIPTVTGNIGPVWYPVSLALMTFPTAAIARALVRSSEKRASR